MQLSKTQNTKLTSLKASRAFYVLPFCFILVCFHLFFYTGHFGFDDLAYAQHAFDLSNWNLQLLNDHYTYRLGVLLPTAIAYILFGVSDGASALMPILASCVILFLVNDMLKKEKLIVALLAIAMLTFTFWNLHYSDKLMPDLWVSFGLCIACFALYKNYFEPTKWKLMMPLLLAFGIFYAFLSKEIVLFAMPAFAFFCIRDFFKKQHQTFWLTTIGLGVLIFGVYFVHQYMATDNVLARIAAIKAGSYYSPTCSYSELPIEHLLRRITYEPFKHLGGGSGFAIPSYLALLAFIFSISKLIKNQRLSFFSTLFFTLFVGAFWMSASLSAYSPICIDPRHFLFLLPTASIAGAMLLFNFSTNKITALLSCIIFTIISVACLVNEITFRESTAIFTLGLIVFTIALYLKKQWVNYVAIAILFIALLISPIIIIKSFNSPNQYKNVKQHTYDLINNNKESTLIVTTEVQARLGNYFNQYGTKNPRLHFGNYQDFNTSENTHYGSRNLWNHGQVLVFNNNHTQSLSGKSADKMPKYMFEPLPNAKVLLNEDGTFIQQIDNISQLTWE